MSTSIDTRQSRNRAALTNVGSAADAKLDTILGLVDGKLGTSESQSAQDRNIKMIGGGLWKWTLSSNILSLSVDAYIQIPGLENQRNTISAGDVTLASDGDVAYVTIQRTGTGANVLSVSIAQIDTVTLSDSVYIIARRIGNIISIGNTFSLKDGEILELDSALAEINRYFGQMQIIPHPIDANRVKVSGSDISKLNNVTLTQTLENLILDFSGAEIDFSTGSVYKSDGATPLGDNFTPITIPATEWGWYSITLIAGDVNADNTITAKINVLPATSTGATKDAAQRSNFIDGLKLGMIAIQENAGGTGLEPIVFSNILQLGFGSGGSGGSGDANSFTTSLLDRLNNSYYEWVTPNVFEVTKDDLVDASSTAEYSFVDKAYKFTNIGDILLSKNNFNDAFKKETIDVKAIELKIKWLTEDAGATIEVAKDGATFETITMSEVGESQEYIGTHSFGTAATSSLYSAGGKTGTESFTTATKSFQIVVPAETKYMTKLITVDLDKTGTPGGNYRVLIEKAGTLVYSTPNQSIADLVAGSQVFTEDLVITEGTYDVIVEVDAIYLASQDGSNYLSWDTNASTYIHDIVGYTYDLRVRVTSSLADVKLEAYGIFYGSNRNGVEQNAGIGVQSSSLVNYVNVADFEQAKGSAGSLGDKFIASSTGMEMFHDGTTWQEVESKKNNYTSTTDPTDSNDVSEGYVVGSKWINNTDNKIYFCVDNTVGNAVWSQGGGGSAGSGSYAFFDADDTRYNKFDTTGLTNAVWGEELVDFLSGKKSYSLTLATGSVGEIVKSPVINVPKMARDKNLNALKSVFNYNGDKNDIQVTIREISTANLEELGKFNINGDDKSLNVFYKMASEYLQIQLEFEVLVDNNGKKLVIDNIDFIKDAYGYGSVTISETITYTGYTSTDFPRIKLKELLKSSGNVLIAHDNTGVFTKVIILKACTINAVGHGARSGNVTQDRIEVYNADNSLYWRSENFTAHNDIPSSVSATLELEKGQYITLSAGDPLIDSQIGCNLSVTATAQSDTVQFEDSYQQAHHVGKALWPTSGSHTWTLSGTSTWGSLINTGADATSPELTGNITVADKDVPKITLTDAKAGVYEVKLTGSTIYAGQASNALRFILDDTTSFGGGNFYVANQTISSVIGTIEITTSGTHTIELQGWQNSANGLYIYNTGNYGGNPFEISVSYLPPVEQASTTRMLAVKSSLENDYKAIVNNNGTATIERQSVAFIDSVSRTSEGRVRVNYKTGIFTIAPYITPSVFGSGGGGGKIAFIIASTTTYCDIGTETNGVATVDVDFMLDISKSGADRSDRHTPVVHGDDVVKEKIATVMVSPNINYYAEIAGTTSYKLRNLESITAIGSVTADELTLPAGQYILTVPIGVNNSSALDFKLVNETTSTDIFERLIAAYSASLTTSWNTLYIPITITETTTFSFWTKAGSTNGYEYMGEIFIRKIL